MAHFNLLRILGHALPQQSGSAVLLAATANAGLIQIQESAFCAQGPAPSGEPGTPGDACELLGPEAPSNCSCAPTCTPVATPTSRPAASGGAAAARARLADCLGLNGGLPEAACNPDAACAPGPPEPAAACAGRAPGCTPAAAQQRPAAGAPAPAAGRERSGGGAARADGPSAGLGSPAGYAARPGSAAALWAEPASAMAAPAAEAARAPRLPAPKTGPGAEAPVLPGLPWVRAGAESAGAAARAAKKTTRPQCDSQALGPYQTLREVKQMSFPWVCM